MTRYYAPPRNIPMSSNQHVEGPSQLLVCSGSGPYCSPLVGNCHIREAILKDLGKTQPKIMTCLCRQANSTTWKLYTGNKVVFTGNSANCSSPDPQQWSNKSNNNMLSNGSFQNMNKKCYDICAFFC